MVPFSPGTRKKTPRVELWVRELALPTISARIIETFLTAIPNTFPTISDGFGPFSDGFGLFSDGFGRFWTVSDGFGPFSDGFGPFSDGFGRFRTVFGSFRIVFRRVPAVLDDSDPNLKNFKFQLATAGARPCRSVRPCRPPQPWPIEI